MEDFERLKEIYLALEFANKLRNQSHLADLSGIDKSVISRMMSGKAPISQQIVDFMQQSFSVNSDYIIYGNGPKFLSSEFANAVNDLGGKYSSEKPSETKFEELMTPERFDRLLAIMDEQQKAINKLIDNQEILAHKIPDAVRSGEQRIERAAGL